MIYYVSQNNRYPGSGTAEDPFRTIGQAAEIAAPGDTVLIGAGVYREWVRPKNGGLSDSQRITYTAAENAHPVISGAEPVTGWQQERGDVWSVTLSSEFFAGHNTCAEEIFGDWFDGFGQKHHTGELYYNGEAMYEAASRGELDQPPRKKERTLRWFAEVNGAQTVLYANFNGQDPNAAQTELSVRPFCFFPEEEGRDYITVSGLTLCYAATQWAPPTAFQPGIIGPNWSRGWIIENCTVHDSKCAGISLGKRREEKDNLWSKDPRKDGSQTYTEMIFQNLQDGWNREKIGSHIVRNNHIYNCGQAGIVGCMGAAFSTITGNHIHHVNIRGEFGGAEMAGIKLHAAVDAVIEGNCIHNCIRGLWMDWQAQGTAVRRNAFFENKEEDLFIEVSHGPCTVENNIMLSKRSFLNVSQGTALVHNLFAGAFWMMPDTNRFTLYHLPHTTMVGGVTHIFGGDDKIANNIFAGRRGCPVGTAAYDSYPDMGGKKFKKPSLLKRLQIRLKGGAGLSDGNPFPVDIHDNVYLGGAKSYRGERGARTGDYQPSLTVKWEDGHAYLYADLYGAQVDWQVPNITTEVLGRSFESGQAYENRDGSPLTVDTDFFGKPREKDSPAGPFAAPQEKIRLV